jgi:hypothetical protein
MSNATFGLLISAMLVASPAIAQRAPDPGAAPALASAPAAKPKPPATEPTVSGIVVEGPPKKTCSSRDRECIAVVVAELKEHYPQQLKAFCAQWKMQAVRTQWVNDQLVESLGGNNPPSPVAFGVNSAVSKACAADKPAEK